MYSSVFLGYVRKVKSYKLTLATVTLKNLYSKSEEQSMLVPVATLYHICNASDASDSQVKSPL